MAGHNKWSKVKRIKAHVDARKGKIFSRFAQEISIAARDGGGDAEQHIVYCESARVNAVAAARRKAGITPLSCQLVSVPQNPSTIEDSSTAKQALRLYGLLDDYEDTVDVSTNLKLPDHILAQLEA